MGVLLQPLRENALPTAEMLEGVDLLLFDIQDIGAYLYVYVHLEYCMVAAQNIRNRSWSLTGRIHLGLIVEAVLEDP